MQQQLAITASTYFYHNPTHDFKQTETGALHPKAYSRI